MKLRTRTLLSVVLSLMILIAILYSVARVSIMQSFATLEADDTRQNVARATAVLTDDLATLDNTTSDYAAWDDTCAYLEGRKPELLSSEIPGPWFTRLRIDFVLSFDTHGRRVFTKAYDPVAGKATEIPQGLGAHLAPGSLLMHHTHPGSKVLGIALLTSGPVLIDSQPIIDSQSRGPIRGTFIAGRRLNAAEVARLAGISHLALALHGLHRAGWPVGGYSPGRAGRNCRPRRGDKPHVGGPRTVPWRAAQSQGRRRSCQHRQKCVPGRDEPRDPYAHERRYRHGWTSSRYPSHHRTA